MSILARVMDRQLLFIALKLLLTIAITEAVIMAVFHLLAPDVPPLWKSAIDTLLLALVSSIVIYLWVIRPLKKAKQQNDLFNTLVNKIDVGVVVTDPNGSDHPIIYTNPAFTKITNYRADEMIGKNPRILQGEEVDQQVLEQVRQAIRAEKSIRVLQHNMRKDGSLFWNDLHLNPIMGANGHVRLWVGLLNDVTETKKLEKENILWASALQQSDEAVCVFDEKGTIETANEAFTRNVRLSAAELVGQSIFVCWDQSSAEFDDFVSRFRNKQSWSGRHTRYRGDLTTYEALTSVTPIHADGALAFVAVHRDISDMVVMEEQLRQAQKMEAVGMLVGGIAHDFNNVLAGMLGNLYLVKSRLKDMPELHQRIESVEEQGFAAAGMVRQLLSFSRKGMPDIKNIDLTPFCKELLKFASISVPESIELVGDIDNGKLVARFDPVQLQQSLLNLIVNATHAMKDRDDGRGRIELSVRASEVPDGLLQNGVEQSSEAATGYVCISVTDNGIGMDAATSARMFEPFFTTKACNVGTGLGLAMVQGYVEMMHGAIDVRTAPGEGTRLRIYLPLSLGGETQPSEELIELRSGRGELILVADDDENVLSALSDILESANYRVLKALNGDQAMQVFSEYAEKLDMAILDVVMPKTSGVQVARHMQAVCHDFPVVLMTGYDKEDAIPVDGDFPFIVLRKPWDISSLNQVLEESLSAGA